MPDALDALVLRVGQEDRHSGFPVDVFTGTGDDPRPRLRVDVAQTAFFEGREFRAYFDMNVGVGATAVLRFTAPVEFILHEQSFNLVQGYCRFSASAGGSAGGSWTPIPVIGKNRMLSRPQPYYEAQCSIDTGGTHTGGTEVEVVRLRTSGNSNFASTVGGGVGSERGLPAGTYYLRFQNLESDTAIGVYTLMWEGVLPRSERLY